ncbi:MAG: hypothetical protein M3P38_11180 [Chloroflexota bacterium]|nr:hypothetical protein [Chloroflexota bacterium]
MIRTTLLSRVVRLALGSGLLVLAAESAYDLFVAFRGLSGGVELSGIQGTLAVAMAVTGLGLVRQSLLRAPRPAVGVYTLFLFGYGWLLGVLVNDAISLIRSNRPTYDSLWVVALDVFSWLVVTLIFAVPGLIALVIARRL